MPSIAFVFALLETYRVLAPTLGVNVDPFLCWASHVVWCVERGGGRGTFLHHLGRYLSENQHMSLTFCLWPRLVLSETEIKSRTPICRDSRRKYLVWTKGHRRGIIIQLNCHRNTKQHSHFFFISEKGIIAGFWPKIEILILKQLFKVETYSYTSLFFLWYTLNRFEK